MEVGNDRSSLLTQITAQLLSNRREQVPPAGSSGAFTTSLPNIRESSPPQALPFSEENDQRLTRDSSSDRSLVRVRGTRSAEELDVSSVEDLDIARENVTNLNAREAPLGRQSQLVEPDVPLGQVVDIRV